MYALWLVKQQNSKVKEKKWWKTQVLYWQGREYKRDSDEYQQLLDRAFNALLLNDGFKKALLATGNSTIKHSIGKRDTTKTVLTEKEFCSRLLKLRTQIKQN